MTPTPFDHVRSPHESRPQRLSLWRLAHANFYDMLLLLRESWIVLTGFVALALGGTLYLTFGYAGAALDPIAALYETLRMLTFQSSLELPGDPLGRVLFFLIPLLGLALIFQSVLNFGRLLLDKTSRREAWQVALASTFRDHVIVCGLGRVGLRVVTQLLDAGYEVVVIERKWQSEFIERALNLGAPVVLGDARESATLRAAGLSRARAVVAAISDDMLTIEIALAARAARPDVRVILRVFNDELDQRLERIFGCNAAFSTSALAAPTYAAAAVSREVDYVLPFDERLLGVARLVVQPDSQVCGFARAIEDSHAIRILHHHDANGRHVGGMAMRPISSGDRIMAIGSLAALQSLRLSNVAGSKLAFLSPPPLQHPTSRFDTVIICGLGKVGYRVVRQLHRMAPRPRIVVVRLDNGRTEFPRHISALEGVETITGDARDLDVLLAAGLDRAYTVAALTSDDLLNLQISLAARGCRPDVHVVLRVFSDTLAERLADMFGIRTIYSTSGLAAPTLAAAAILGDVSHAFFTNGHLFSTDQFVAQADGPLTGQTVEAIRARYGALVIGLRRADSALALPANDVAIAPGDTVTVLAMIEALARLRMADKGNRK